MTTSPTPLPDLAGLLRDLQVLVETESPSGDSGIWQVQNSVAGWLEELGASSHGLPGEVRQFLLGVQGTQETQGMQETQERPLLILMHADTVWPRGTLEHMPFRVEGVRAYGPGSYDMKGGIVGAVHALRSLERQWPA
ncbi:MAG: M20/M25/M40 family metallo-hydrolase, partial [Deinococcus sp.]